MTSNYPNPEQDYTVLVRCFTFNQSKYIEDALNGFVMQQTTFPFVCCMTKPFKASSIYFDWLKVKHLTNTVCRR